MPGYREEKERNMTNEMHPRLVMTPDKFTRDIAARWTTNLCPSCLSESTTVHFQLCVFGKMDGRPKTEFACSGCS